MTPSAPLETSLFGKLKLGWLSALTKSPRSSNESLSRQWKVLPMDKLTTVRRGPTSEVRRESPNVPGVAAAKAPVLNQQPSDPTASPLAQLPEWGLVPDTMLGYQVSPPWA